LASVGADQKCANDASAEGDPASLISTLVLLAARHNLPQIVLPNPFSFRLSNAKQCILYLQQAVVRNRLLIPRTQMGADR